MVLASLFRGLLLILACHQQKISFDFFSFFLVLGPMVELSGGGSVAVGIVTDER